MATSEQKNVSARAEEEHLEEAPVPPAGPGSVANLASTAGVDDLLDEIDGVLESNAEEFVRGFVQKGGE
ncbi:ubiquitin-like protein Pup [Arthrobacter cryoconiti]|uniref:Prokaryotic ubiquitin-like protein Pup n=1 Tax=Arthrobacter cryoconiti TaxID=748907 RepID=A0ABV8R3J7_9MICC|nr:ubiquitin-like protein Pup [Arthrobacter cryoconiti]MCC9069848.1 ubiquitin-like protein Pup [Arthrobacter cryoconiti]